MHINLNPNLKNIQISGIRKFTAIAKQIPEAIHLTIGEPDFHTPEHIKQAAIHAIKNNDTAYTPNGGKPELRQAAAKYFQKKYALEYHPETELLVTHGATQALHTAFQTILTPGDEVIIPAPIYPGYAPIVQMCGAKIIYIDTSQTNFKLTPDTLQNAITSRTKIIVLPYPNNPTGTALTKEEMRCLISTIEHKNIWIISDEIYSEICFQAEHVSIGHFPTVRKQSIIIQGLSKSHAMTGWRIGFLLGPETFIQQAIKAQQYHITCPCTISQAAALSAVTNGIHDSIKMCAEYQLRGFYLAERLQEIGFTVNKPAGTFYLFANHTKSSNNSFDFALWLLENAKVAATPGTAFDPYGQGYMRFSFANSLENIKKACDAIELVLS